jgi:hypothetical protein
MFEESVSRCYSFSRAVGVCDSQRFELAGSTFEELTPPFRHVFTDRERITGYAEVGGVPTTASRSNGRLGSGTVPGVPVVASEMLVLFERIEDDWTEPGPASKRRRAAA